VHIYILGHKLLQWNFLQISHTKWCAQIFPPIFGLFAIFDHNFAKIVAPPSNKNENYVVHLKEQSIPKKSWKPHQNQPHKPSHIVWTISPRAGRPYSVTYKTRSSADADCWQPARCV